MKPQHTQLLTDLVNYEVEFEAHIVEYQKKLAHLDPQSSPQLLALEFSNRALDILSNISALLSPPRAS